MKKRMLSMLLALVMLLGLLPTAALAADDIASGTDWVLDATGNLTIKSDAGMQDWYSSGNTRKESVTSVEIQSGVTSISNWAFDTYQNLIGVTIPDSVTSIGTRAFADCSRLARITIPKNLTSIGNYAFKGCTALTNITIPESVTSIGNYAFWNCTALTNITIPEDAQVTTIGQSAFSDCSSLKSITIPKNVTSIGNSAFESCAALASITIPESVTSIGNNAFYYCTALKSITIPKNVTSIGSSAFYYCTALESVTIPENAQVTSIGENVFSFCVSLTSITLPESVTSIGSSAFKNCEALTSITIPESVISIGSSAFSTCRALTTVTMLPETPPTFGAGVFSGCKFSKEQTTGIHVPEGTEQAYKTEWQAWADYITDGTQKSDHNHPVCGNNCVHAPAHETVPWKALNQDSFTGDGGKPKAGSGVTLDGSIYKLAEGHYYLAESVSLDKKIYINSSTVDLCLNGQTLTSKIAANSGTQNAIEVSYNAGLNLCDCAGSGKITANGAIYTLEIKGDAGSFANLYGGTVDNPTGICVETRGNLVLDGATLTAGGDYVINAQSTSAVTIKSGKVEGSVTSCVQMTSSTTFAMTGGTVTNTGSGSGVFMSNQANTVSGGTIHSEMGTGIYLLSNSFTLSGTPKITGEKADIAIHADSSITVGDDLTGCYTVFRDNWNASSGSNSQDKITEAKPYTFTTAASEDHSSHFTAATQMPGIAVRNSDTGSGQQVQLYMPHNWSSGWEQNATHHWHICHNRAEGNCIITNYATCGEEGAEYGEHEWADEYEKNETQHRKKCTICYYAETSWTPHTWTDDHDLDCNVCGYERIVPLYGTVTVNGIPKLGVPLTATVTDAPSDVTLKYAWTAAGSSAVLGTDSTYTPTASEVGKTLTVTVTTEDTRYTGSLTATTAAVDKGDQTAPVGIFTITDAAYGQTTGTIAITGDATKLEYRAKPTGGSEPAWSNASSSNTLPAGSYEFRYKETPTHYASTASEVRILVKTPDDKALSIDPDIKHGTVTKRRDEVTPGLLVNLTVKPAAGYELAALAANHGNGQTIIPDRDPANSEHYTFTMPNADVTVTAAFRAITYTIDYQWAGVADGSFTVETANLTLAAPTRPGFTLSGWAFAEGGTVIGNVTAAALMEKAVGRTVKLYPVWTVTPDEGEIRGEVETGEGAPEVDVDTDSLKALADPAAPGQTVTVKLTVVKKDDTADGAGKIKQEAAGKTVEFLDLSLVKTVNGSSGTPIEDTGNKVLKIEVEYDLSKKKDVTVYRHHKGTVEAFTKNDTQNDRTFQLGTDSITIYTTKFSTYAIAYTPDSGGNQPQPPSGGGGTGGGGGGYVPPTYPVELPASTPGGKLTSSHKSASSGATVTLTPTPDEGYALGGVTVTDRNGKPVAVTAGKDGHYTFTMPSGGVTVKAEFVKRQGGYATCPRDSSCPIWPYTDASPTAWYHDALHFCLENGLMQGYGQGLLGPGRSVSRAEFVQMLYNREGRPAAGGFLAFEDVPNGAWYGDAVRWASVRGITGGYGNGQFAPGRSITRQELAVMLHRYAGSPAATNKELHFADADKVSDYAREALSWAVENGIVQGKSGGILDPGGNATRAEAAAMLQRFCGKEK